MKRYNFKDDFEMLYLRHDYITKVKDPDPEWIRRHASVVHTTAKLMFKKLKPNFDKVGFQVEDLIAITNVYLIGYMGLYSLTTNKKQFNRYVEKFKVKYGEGSYPTEIDIIRKDRNNMISFLRQRIQHCSTLCSRKARNITVGVDKRGAFAETSKTIKASKEFIIKEHKKYGYRKLTKKELTEARLRGENDKNKSLLDEKGYKIVEIEMLNGGINRDDYCLLFQQNRGPFSQTPEDAFISIEENKDVEENRVKFNTMMFSKKRRMLNNFIAKNKEDKSMKDELSVARKLLRKPKSVV